jgi:O-antigen ligase
VSSLKWIALLAGLIAAYPLGWFLRTRPRLLLLAWTALGLLPFLGARDLGLVPLTGFLGDTHGMEVSLVDFLALALLFSRPVSFRRVPYRAAMAFYFLVALFSVTQAALPQAALFYPWRLLRFYLLFLALVQGATNVHVVLAVVRGMAVGVFYEFYLTMQQRFYAYQSPGTFTHQNSLGLALNLFLMVPIALILARKTDWLTMLCPVAGLIAVVLTRSRGTLIFFVLGVVLVYGLSLLKGGTGRKMLIAVLGGVVALAVLGRAADRITERFSTAPESSMDTRGQFEKAASIMRRDHPLGIGANHFAWYLEKRGYGDQVGLLYGNRAAIVHNVYWLTTAELGLLGLVALVVLFLGPLVDAMRYAFRAPPGDVRGELLLGLGVGLLMCYLQSAFEWAWRATDVSYVYWIVVALVGALARQVRRRSARARVGSSGRRERGRADVSAETAPAQLTRP